MKFIDKPIAGVVIGGGTVAVAQYGLSQIPYDGTGGVQDMIVKWSNSIGLALGLAGAGVLFAMKAKDTAAIAALAAVVAGSARVIDEVQINMAAGAMPASPAAPADGPPQGIAVIQRRGFGRPPAVSLFGAQQNRANVLGPSQQLQSRVSTQNTAAFGGGHF